MPEDAVRVRDAVKMYSGGKDRQLALDHLNMTVPKGCIYGLLGASGCGKTTLLSCIAGRLKLNEGELTVLGGVPGTMGRRIGYMPQEVALIVEFTVKGAIYYFGWLFGLTNSEVAERFRFLSKLLQLPPGGQHVRELSGGQQRRLSLAVALVHDSDLLILDEPTVGLDPLLRQSIWDYLVDEISRDRNKTVIITTHYIEEARQAHKIGLMREGTLLAETSPSRLIAQHNCSNLEDVFLILSRRQGAGESFRNRIQNVGQDDEHEDVVQAADMEAEMNRVNRVHFDELSMKPPLATRSRNLPLMRMKAQLYKNFVRVFSSTDGMYFVFFFPFIQVVSFFLAIGGDVQNLHLGYVNAEMGDCSAYSGLNTNFSTVRLIGEDFDTCQFTGLSCLYMSKLNGDTTINIHYDSVESAIAGTRSGKNLGVVYFPGNFSDAMVLRNKDGKDATDDAVEASTVSVWLDMSDSQLSTTLRQHLLVKYVELAEEVSRGCNISLKLASIPMKFNDPVLGPKESSFTAFMAPGMITSMVFFLSLSLTATVIIIEKSEGFWDRNLVAGVTTTEILLCHLLVQFCCMLVQMAEVLLIAFFWFHLECLGNVAAVLVLVLLQALCGVSFGLLLSVVCKDLQTANYAGLGSFYPYILLSGLMWPLEGMPTWLRYFSYTMPGTWATTALRNILIRGWSFTHAQVWPGFAISLFWLVVFLAACFVMFRREKK